MKATTLELTLTRWPYGLEVQPSGKGTACGLDARPARPETNLFVSPEAAMTSGTFASWRTDSMAEEWVW